MSRETGVQHRGSRILTLALTAVFGLFFAYDLWEALGNLFGIVSYANSLQVAIAGWGWVVLVTAVALPALLWFGASWAAWRRPFVQQFALQLTALAVSATSYLSIITMFNDTNLFVLR